MRRGQHSPESAAVRFIGFIVEKGGHWHWQGGVQFRVGGKGSARYAPRRAAWIVFKGPVADDVSVVNACGVHDCVRPDCQKLGPYSSSALFGVYRGTANGKAKLTEKIVTIARRMAKAGWTHADICALFGVSEVTISKAMRGLTWKHVAEPANSQKLRGDGVRSHGYMRRAISHGGRRTA